MIQDFGDSEEASNAISELNGQELQGSRWDAQQNHVPMISSNFYIHYMITAEPHTQEEV